MSESQSCSQVAVDEPLEFIEREIRCSNCGRLFTKMNFMIDKTLHVVGDVKIGIETKCGRCKEIDNKIFVV